MKSNFIAKECEEGNRKKGYAKCQSIDWKWWEPKPPGSLESKEKMFSKNKTNFTSWKEEYEKSDYYQSRLVEGAVSGNLQV